jgi:hypothetical protein
MFPKRKNLFPELLHTQVTVRRQREEGFMIYVRETMIDFLQYRNILIILDAALRART